MKVLSDFDLANVNIVLQYQLLFLAGKHNSIACITSIVFELRVRQTRRETAVKKKITHFKE